MWDQKMNFPEEAFIANKDVICKKMEKDVWLLNRYGCKSKSEQNVLIYNGGSGNLIMLLTFTVEGSWKW